MDAQIRSEADALILDFWPELSAEARARVLRFYELLLDENSRQNLTRLTSPQEFVEGHLWDVRELLKSGLVQYPAMDLGSGGGVPGLLSCAVLPEIWVLCDSEARKAEFLSRAAEELGLSSYITVVAGRAETWLKAHGPVKSVVARAVGPVERIYSWLHACSTWNNLVLLKGPGWGEEWKSFLLSRWRKDLKPIGEYTYLAGSERKSRLIIRLARVPRGTSAQSSG